MLYANRGLIELKLCGLTTICLGLSADLSGRFNQLQLLVVVIHEL